MKEKLKEVKGFVIAIDGPAGVGKSTIAKTIAERLGFYYLNSGNFYRALTLSAIEAQVDLEDEASVLEVARQTSLSVKDGRLYANDKDVEDLLHSEAVDAHVAQHSAIVELRSIVNENFQHLTQGGMNVVAEGRDMTTVVFPHADVKVFLDASIEVRTQRRLAQQPTAMSYEELYATIKARDEIDRNKPVGGLRVAEKALFIDSSHLTIDEVCDRVLSAVFPALVVKIRVRRVKWKKEGSVGNTRCIYAVDAAGAIPQIS